MLSGTVTSFDAHVGLGQITTSDGAIVMFHCAEIIDGSRAIDVGTSVNFELLTKFSRNEASAIRSA
jgi:cold shock CspA family protein